MDQSTLVERQIADGGKVVEEIVRSGFPVQASFWARENDSDRWHLYLVSPTAEEPRAGYRRILPVVRKMPQPLWVEPSELTLIEPTEPLAKAVLQLQRSHPGKLPGRFTGRWFGWTNIEEGYVYAPVEAESSQTTK
jgi:hypothetical protein